MTSRIFMSNLLFEEGSRPGERSDHERRGAAQHLASIRCRGPLPVIPNTRPKMLFRPRRIRSCRPAPSREPAAPANFVRLAVIPRGIEAGVFRENPLAGDVIDLDP